MFLVIDQTAHSPLLILLIWEIIRDSITVQQLQLSHPLSNSTLNANALQVDIGIFPWTLWQAKCRGKMQGTVKWTEKKMKWTGYSIENPVWFLAGETWGWHGGLVLWKAGRGKVKLNRHLAEKSNSRFPSRNISADKRLLKKEKTPVWRSSCSSWKRRKSSKKWKGRLEAKQNCDRID